MTKLDVSALSAVSGGNRGRGPAPRPAPAPAPAPAPVTNVQVYQSTTVYSRSSWFS